MGGDWVSGRVCSCVYNGDNLVNNNVNNNVNNSVNNNVNSYNTPGIFVQRDALNLVASSINFEIDATDINNAVVPVGSGAGAEAYRRLVAGSGVGIWYYVAKNSIPVANVVDGVSKYVPGTQGWYHRGGLRMEPEPGRMGLLGVV